MGALPKNKITRVEQGKRRRGNTPKLLKDSLSRVPLHKQGFVAELMRSLGLSSKSQMKSHQTKDSQTPGKVAKSTSPAAAKVNAAQPTRATRSTQPTAATKQRRQTQHKG